MATFIYIWLDTQVRVKWSNLKSSDLLKLQLSYQTLKVMYFSSHHSDLSL